MGRWALILWCAVSVVKAQDVPSDTVGYIIEYADPLTFRTTATVAGNSFVFRDREDPISFKLDPARSASVYTSLQYRSVELGFGFSPGFLNPDRELESARVYNLDFRVYAGRWMQTFTYLDQQGFRADLAGERFYFPEFGSRKVGGTTSYKFNPHFSFRSVFAQSEWQAKSAGSFVPRLTGFYTRYRADLGEGEDTLHTFDVSLGPGYHYTWVVHPRGMVSAGNTTALGISFLDSGPDATSYWLWETQFRLNLAYNTPSFYAGLGMQYSFYEHGAGNDIRLDDKIYFFQLYAGYRFKAPNFLKRTADQINRTFGWD